ncbi:hypothetical protein DB88DRAFT_475643 [Papiliotrema laurentii]|uniref:Uncharacterized protein n=1 Tax=Papiliotrema laurentii TaxID=5418 RepID=A0AAD9CUA9_PAPLA|nr:hypothetical protein DB88DRAFT_513864 [Papiliotrema laurentii]KAK1920719.1 hypothetical protein DB88DRAFT_475643 [Papiliotrema laurentii]
MTRDTAFLLEQALNRSAVRRSNIEKLHRESAQWMEIDRSLNPKNGGSRHHLGSQADSHQYHVSDLIQGVVSPVAFAFLPRRVGRRSLSLLSLALLLGVVVRMTATSAIYAKASLSKAASYVFIARVKIFSPADNLGFNGTCTAYISEINIFHMRLAALALKQVTTNCVRVIFQYATPIALDVAWTYLSIYVPWILTDFVVV